MHSATKAAECIFLKKSEKRNKMKRIVYILAVILAFSCTICAFVGCEKEEEIVYTDYSVKFIDTFNAPVANVVVKFTYPDGTVKSRVTEEDGTASLKNVPEGDYQVHIDTEFSKVITDNASFCLSKDNTSITVVVFQESKSTEIYGELEGRTYAQPIGVGEHDIYCDGAEMSYFIFHAQQQGTYKVSLPSNAKATVGYYGIPLFVQSTHKANGEYDGKSFELVIRDIATPYVFGIFSDEESVEKLTIERTGEAPFDPHYADWTTVLPENDIPKCTLPEGAILDDLNIASSNLSVTLGDDGYYYTSDGQLVYLRIGSTGYASYLDVSIAYIAGLVDKNFGQNFGGYVYDENGEFVAKYSFNEMLAAYYEQCDSTGVYPLTEELATAIKVHGNSAGWWKPGTVNYLFGNMTVDPDTAWLFLCCTIL